MKNENSALALAKGILSQRICLIEECNSVSKFLAKTLRPDNHYKKDKMVKKLAALQGSLYATYEVYNISTTTINRIIDENAEREIAELSGTDYDRFCYYLADMEEGGY